MSTVEQIEEAILKLSREGLAELRRWFDEFDATEWDRQFEQDVNDGKLDELGRRALRDVEEGRCREL